MANDVHASCSESICGLSSIATSRFAHQLPKQPFSLQEVLRLYGYGIHMVPGGDHTVFYNLRAIYGKVDSYFDASTSKTRYYMNDEQLVIDKTESMPTWDGTPVMIQYHLMSAHPLGWRMIRFEKFQPHVSYASRSFSSTTEAPPGLNKHMRILFRKWI